MIDPGRSTSSRRETTRVFAIKTAIHGRNTAPSAGTSIHQPGTKKQMIRQTTRMPIVTAYLTIRDARS